MKTSPLILVGLLLASALSLIGCGEKATDPNEKIDTPGYYNGKMEKKGSGGAAGSTKTNSKADAK